MKGLSTAILRVPNDMAIVIAAMIFVMLLAGCSGGGDGAGSPSPATQPTPSAAASAALPPTAQPPPSPAVQPTPPPPTQPANPVSVIKGYHDALNAKKVDEAVAFFADDGVLVDPFGTFKGKEQIRNRLLVTTDRNITFEVTDFQVVGDKVTWHQKVFRSGSPLDEGSNEAVVRGGKIVTLGKPPQAPATAQPTLGTAEIADPWGVVTIKKGDTIKIALTVDKDLGSVDRDLGLGAQLGVADFGKAIAPGFNLALVPVADHSSVPWTGAADAIVRDPQIVGVIGTLFSNTMIAQSDILDKAHYVMVSPLASAAQVTARGLTTVNRTAFNDNIQGPAAANFVLTQLKLKTAAIIYDDTAYGQGLGQGFKDTFEKGGGKITNFEARKTGETDFAPILARIAPLKPQLLFFAGSGDKPAVLVQQKYAAGLQDMVFLGSDSTFNLSYIQAAAGNAEGTYASAALGSKGTGYGGYVQEYLAANGKKEEIVFSPLGYDAVGVMAKALRSVAKVDSQGNLEIGRQALARAVRATQAYPGITGAITFDQQGDRLASNTDVAIYQVQKGKWVQVYPLP